MTKADSVHTTPPTNTSANDPGPPYRRTDISPETFFQALGRARRAARDEIEQLIDWLDSTIDCDRDAAVDDGPCDGDTDAEARNFRPHVGPDQGLGPSGWGDVDMEFDRTDQEPSLGAPESQKAGSQKHWASGAGDDREGDPGCDDWAGTAEKPSTAGIRARWGCSDDCHQIPWPR
jgi:hypothetical protein